MPAPHSRAMPIAVVMPAIKQKSGFVTTVTIVMVDRPVYGESRYTLRDPATQGTIVTSVTTFTSSRIP